MSKSNKIKGISGQDLNDPITISNYAQRGNPTPVSKVAICALM